MKNLLFLFTVLCFSACVKEASEANGTVTEVKERPQVEDGPHIVFTASTETLSGKLSLDGLNTVWAVGDLIAVVDASGNRSLYRATSEGQTTSFEYLSGSGPVKAPYTAWYPAETADGFIPLAQTCTDGKLATIPMKAVSSTSEFSFKNLTGIVKIHLSGPHSNICAVSLTADKGLGGPFDASVEPGQPALVSGRASVQITPAAPVDITEGKDFFFAAVPGNYSSFYLAVMDTEENLAYYSGSGVAVRRSEITAVNPIEVLSMGGGGQIRDLSSAQTANCYLPAKKSDYKFYARAKGNNGKSAKDFTPASADILWSESSGQGPFDAIKPVIFYNGYVYFRKCSSEGAVFYPGNAVVAVRDASGKILWSWHLWMPEETSETGDDISSKYANSAGTVMTYSLGETKAGRNGGCFYQWGRKDPFPADYQSRAEFPAAVETSAGTGNEAYTTTHPTQFIYGNDKSCFDWSHSVRDGKAWGATAAKSLYDPCPPGWRVPEGAGMGISGYARGATPITLKGLWTVAFGTEIGFCGKNPDNSLYWDAERKGVSLPASVTGESTWFAAGGHLNPENGKLVEENLTGSCWTRCAEESAAGIASAAFCFSFGASSRINPSSLSNKAAGRNVRCVKE